ncbi:HNH endonuclease signature motif containing protein [Mesorhizobium sp. M0098]
MCIQSLRRAALIVQNYNCYYCEFPIWESDCEGFARTHGISTKLARRFRATAEHLIPRCEGGPDTRGNIVAACLHCNTARHRPAVPLGHEDYKARVSQAIKKRKWHPASAYGRLAAAARSVRKHPGSTSAQCLAKFPTASARAL